MKIIKVAGIFFSMLLMAVGTAFACGPWFDDAYLVRTSKEQFLAIPEGIFWLELKRIGGQTEQQYGSREDNTAAMDIKDLEEACQKSGLDNKEKGKIFDKYTFIRSQIVKLNGGEFKYYEGLDEIFAPEINPTFDLPETIPKEFKLYLEGAVAYHNYKFTAAIDKWKELLALPREERYFKTVWASYMIGKTWLAIRKSKEAISYFEMTRKYVQEGFKDSLNLSEESYGWQALAEKNAEDYVSSIHHYLKPLDAISLSWICGDIIHSKEPILSSVINDEISRKVLIIWAITRTSTWSKGYYPQLLSALEQMDSQEIIDGADKIAWLYYNQGDIDNTKKWLKLSQEKTALAKFIASKLMLRDGEIESAIRKLQEVLPFFEELPAFKDSTENTGRLKIVQEINSELGVLKLNRKEYVAALDLLIQGRFWEDAAYVAEKVLTSAELEKYLQNNKMWYDKLSYLLARRFAREGKWDKAIKYMPVTSTRSVNWNEETFYPKEELEKLAAHIRNVQDTKLSGSIRAKNYYDAAIIMRNYGLELVGTELEPDWFSFHGQFTDGNSIEHRFAILNKESPYYNDKWYAEFIERIKKRRAEIEKRRDFYTGSQDEEKRALASLPNPNKRFHYRYKAADLMWKCAQLLPNNDELKAKALCLGGTYLKISEPKLADKFYKALVRTCGKTELGKAADKLRWFPDAELIQSKATKATTDFNSGRYYEGVIAAYDKIIAIEPDNYIAWITKGVALNILGRSEEAIAAYEKAIKIYPNDSNSYYNLACIYSLKKDKLQALRYLGIAIIKGYNNLKHMENDHDLDFVRDTPEYWQIVDKLKTKST